MSLGKSCANRISANQLDISRSPVSEAVTRLAAEGLVDVVPQAGTFVARFSMAEIREGAFLREALEIAAVELVAKTITDDQVKMLQRNLLVQQAFVDDLDVQGFYQLDSEMHNLILELYQLPAPGRRWQKQVGFKSIERGN